MPTLRGVDFDSIYINSLRQALDDLGERSAAMLEKHGSLPISNSIGAKEYETCARPESIVTACTLAEVFIDYGVQQLSILQKALVEPIQPLAVAACVRSMLEACAITTWITDPTIDSTERISRVFAHRYEGLQRKIQFTRVVDHASSEIAEFKKRVDDVERDAAVAGYLPVTGKDRKKRIGIGQVMPKPTALIARVLDEEGMYSLLSAIAHSHFWAIKYFGYTVAPVSSWFGSTPLHTIEKVVDLQKVAVVAFVGIKAFSRGAWSIGLYSGWDRSELVATLEHVFNLVEAKDSQRFWR